MYCFNRFKIDFFVIVFVFSWTVSASYKQKSVYQRISTEGQFTTFDSLVQKSSLAKRAILYWNSTVFAPKNEAFDKFSGNFTTDLVYYHISNELKSIQMIFDSNYMNPLADGYPPLWISKIDGDIYVNNAKILTDSDYFSRASGGYYNFNQALHVIDDVLEPPSVHLDNPTAFDLISNFTKHDSLTTSNYYNRINTLELQKLFRSQSWNTYFVPIDEGYNQYRYRMTDKYIIDGHIIPNQVLFTRPTLKNFGFESKANGDYIYSMVSFIETNGKFYVKSNTILGDSNHQKGELLSEIVKANVPVKNGVVHFINKPLGIFDMELKPFPYLPILSKLSGDPELNITYELGKQTKFNDHLENTHSLLTFFVPRDTAWNRYLQNLTGEDSEDLFKLLGKHLVVSDVRYTMQKLWFRSFDRIITLNTLGGAVDVKIVKNKEGEYSILYGSKSIKVHRPDFLCTNGIIHIIDEPFILARGDNKARELKMQFWKSLEDFIF